MKRSPLRRVSKKRAAENVVRRRILAEVVHGKLCARCKSKWATDGHERLSRARGGSITDPANIDPLCRECHDYVTTHPKWAEENGWSESRWSK